MQIVTSPLEIVSTDWSPEKDIERSEGVHLSHVLTYIEEQLGKKYENNSGGQNYMAMGFVWERLLEVALNEPENPNIIRPGEQCLNGIYLTPDGYNIADGCLEEWKCTWKSCHPERSPIDGPKFQRWFWQQMGYCKALGLTKSRLRVFYINGDYGANRRPMPFQYDISFTQSEIDDNWDMVLAHAEIMHGEGLIDWHYAD